MNRITTAESSVTHKFQPTNIRTEIVQGKLVLEQHGQLIHSMFMPMHYEPKYAYPLVVWLHGDEDDERQLHRIMPHLSLRNFVAAAPRGERCPKSSNESSAVDGALQEGSTSLEGTTTAKEATCQDDVELPRSLLASPGRFSYRWTQSEAGIEHAAESIAHAIDHATTRSHVNRRKVVLVGFESGATMALRVGLQDPERFAGVVAIGGGLPKSEGRLLSSLSGARKLPVLLCQGRFSQTYSDEQLCHDMRLLHIAGLMVTLRQYPCGDDLVDLMLKDANAWIMERVSGGLIS